MHYLLLAYGDEQRWDAMSSPARALFEQACLANNVAMQASGRLLAMACLPRSATTVQICDGQVAVNEGPFVATSAPIVGIFLIEARDLNEAIRVAAQMPQVQSGSIEIRSMANFTG